MRSVIMFCNHAYKKPQSLVSGCVLTLPPVPRPLAHKTAIFSVPPSTEKLNKSPPGRQKIVISRYNYMK